MKKYFVWAVLMMAMCLGLSSCGKEDGEPQTGRTLAEHLCGVQWKEYGTNRQVRMYRNHLVETWVNGAPTSGQLTGGDSFYGTWTLTGDNLTTTFTAGNNTGFDQNMLMHGTLTIGAFDSNKWESKDAKGVEHKYYYSQWFTDYTDDTTHDKALHGTWTTTVKVGSGGSIKDCTLTITVNRDGTIRYVLPELDNTDRTSTYTTKNGHVALPGFVQEGRDASYIYVRYDDRIEMMNEEKGVTAMRWYIKK